MLNEEELAFINYWEEARERESSVSQKIKRGLPMALVFGLPIPFSIIAVYWLSPDWYTRVSKSVSTVAFTIVIAVIISIFFFSFMRMHLKWEMNEQQYLELKKRQRASDAAEKANHTS